MNGKCYNLPDKIGVAVQNRGHFIEGCINWLKSFYINVVLILQLWDTHRYGIRKLIDRKTQKAENSLGPKYGQKIQWATFLNKRPKSKKTETIKILKMDTLLVKI